MKRKFLLIALLAVVSLGYSQKKWSLRECVDTALNKNITVQQNKLNLLLAEKDVAIAKGNFLPSVNGSSGGNFRSGLSQDENGVLKNTNNVSANFGINVNGTIFNGYRNLNTYKQAKLGVESSKLTLAKIENDISLFVVNGYLNVLFAKENLGVAKVQAEISSKQVDAAKSRFEAGVIPRGDLLNVESTAANDAQNVITQENILNIALLNLAQLLQVPYEGFDVLGIEVGSPSERLLYANSNMVYEKALETQPQIKNAELGIKNADLSIEISKSFLKPTVSYNLGSSTSYFNQLNNLFPGQTNESFFDQLNNRLQHGVGISVNIPIFNGFQNKNNVAKSILNKDAAQLALDSEKLNLQQTIEQAYLDTKAASKSYEAAKISLDSQREAFKNAQERYNFGAMSLFDFDLVRNRLVSAESTLIRAKYDFVFKTKVLQFYYGELNLN
ncbi:TolC family protein [Flavobacteriaceae bacterium S356]|uniref:TolC family protein n=1 Tax=Asprobacillus argus TaxID=3076534 RepID=A0ABU3LH83_9FLAO|nr:TolC family protein [Flavobacteriaceae bacterium S356]